MRRTWATLAFAAAVGFVACSARDAPPQLGDDSTANGQGGGSSVDAGEDGQGTPGIHVGDKLDPDAACGYASVDAVFEPASLYLIVDRSGSMADDVNGKQKLTATRIAVHTLFQSIGWRTRIGAALFPAPFAEDSCSAGKEVFSTRMGDAKSYFDEGTEGPTAKLFRNTLAVAAGGGTPISATLRALTPTIVGLEGQRFVLLATDGGPNCNPATACGPEGCIPNIEHRGVCEAPINCCDPTQGVGLSNLDCLDGKETIDAIVALAEQGVKVIVLGIPGTEAYAPLLDAMAVAGGLPLPGDRKYYQVTDLDALTDQMLKIGTEVTVSCEISLLAEPPNPDEVNVYFDGKVVKQDEDEGWTYQTRTRLLLHGDACDSWTYGAVQKLEVFLGCPTEKIN
jgi:hypothetical protein